MLKEIEEYQNHLTNFGYTKETLRVKLYHVKILAGFFEKEPMNSLYKIDCSTFDNFRKYINEINSSKSFEANNLKSAREFFNYLIITGKIKINPFSRAKKEPSYTEGLKKYFDEYVNIRTHNLDSAYTMTRIKSSIKILLSYLADIDITRFRDITKNDIKSFISHLIEKEDNKGNRVYKAVSINRILFDIKNFFLFLKDKGITPDVLSAIVYLRHAEKLSRNILTRKEITELFKVEAENHYEFMMKTLFVCLYSTGLRIGELLSLKLKDVDYDNKVLTIYESKTRKERYAHVGEVGINYLKIFITHVRDKIGYETDTTNLVFISNTERSKISLSTIKKYLKMFCKKAGITKDITSHCFRHSYGSHFLENGADIKIISELLGHAQISSTERYTKLGSESLRKVINKFHPREQEANKWN